MEYSQRTNISENAGILWAGRPSHPSQVKEQGDAQGEKLIFESPKGHSGKTGLINSFFLKQVNACAASCPARMAQLYVFWVLHNCPRFLPHHRYFSCWAKLDKAVSFFG